MAPSKVFFSLLFSFLLLAMLLKEVESQNTSFNINNDFRPQSPILTYERDAFVPPGTRYLRLTPSKGSVGRVLYNRPVNFWATGRQASFHMVVTLQMTTTGGHDFGTGLTFFILPVNSTLPSGGLDTNLGIYDAVPARTPIFAVEIDNGRGDLNPDYPHVGININSQRSQNLSWTEGMVGFRVSVQVLYDTSTKTIFVWALSRGRLVLMTYVFDLAAILPQQVQVGLSASTGLSNVTYIDIYSWYFVSTMETDVIGAHRDNVLKQYGM